MRTVPAITLATSCLLGLTAVAYATPSICDADSQDIIQNCGFEQGSLSDWISYNNQGQGHIGITSVGPNSGTYALDLTGAPPYGDVSAWQNFYTNVGQTYTGSLYIKDLSNSRDMIFWALAEDGPDGGTVNTEYLNFRVDGQTTAYNNWTKVSFSFTADTTEGSIWFEVDNSGEWLVDDVQIDPPSQVPEPATLTLLGAGFVAAAAIGCRRKKVQAAERP